MQSDEVLSGEYNKLVSEIIDKMYSPTATELNAIIEGPLFRKVLSDHLGFELANFYFYDEDEGRLMFFHEAVEEGIEMPFYRILKRKSDDTFQSVKVDDQDLRRRRALQMESLTSGEEPLTAMLCYTNLTGALHRWSASEEKNNWILIPEGEIIVFSLEYALRQRLADMGFITKASALKAIEKDSLAEECWNEIHKSSTFIRMAGRESESFRSGLTWLREVLRHRADYKYLWDCKPEGRNWFITSHKDLIRLIDDDPPQDLEVIKELAKLIIRNSFPPGEKAQIDLQSARFYERSRISPSLELLHGTHNIVVFLIKFFFPSGLVQFDEPLKVFLLGTFYSRELCELHHDKIRNIYSLVTTRDLFRYSMAKLAGAIRTFRKTEEIMATLSGSTFVHELKNPLALIRANADLALNKTKSDKGLQSIETNLVRIRAKAIEALEVLEASRNIAMLALNTKKTLLNLPAALPEIVSKIRERISAPNQVTTTVECAENRLLVYINETSLNIILENLIRNAIEAMRGKGVIVLGCRRDGSQVKLSVADDGPGIDKKILPRMFELLSSTKREEGKGLGLGLYLCKNLIELQGGTITGENLETGGAVFTVTFKATNL